MSSTTATKRKRKPPALGLHIRVEHPASNTEQYMHCSPEIARRNQQQDEDAADDDGHQIHYSVDKFVGWDLVEVSIRRGISKEAAANILRKLADLIEANGRLVNGEQGESGDFVDGVAEESILSCRGDYNPDGTINMPQVMTWTGEQQAGPLCYPQ